MNERMPSRGNDILVLCDWWRCKSGELPKFAFVLRATVSPVVSSGELIGAQAQGNSSLSSSSYSGQVHPSSPRLPPSPSLAAWLPLAQDCRIPPPDLLHSRLLPPGLAILVSELHGVICLHVLLAHSPPCTMISTHHSAGTFLLSNPIPAGSASRNFCSWSRHVSDRVQVHTSPSSGGCCAPTPTTPEGRLAENKVGLNITTSCIFPWREGRMDCRIWGCIGREFLFFSLLPRQASEFLFSTGQLGPSQRGSNPVPCRLT
jgi:hypothetical protein